MTSLTATSIPTNEKSNLEIAFIRSINFIGNISTGRVPQALFGALGGRILGFPWAIGAFQGITMGITADLLEPIERRCRSNFGPGVDQINKKGATLIECTILAVALIGPAVITKCAAPTVLNVVGSYMPSFLASWVCVDSGIELSLTRLSLTLIAPLIAEIILKGTRQWNEEIEREKTNAKIRATIGRR